MKNIIIILSILVFGFSLAYSQDGSKAKNVILLIADGTGIGQITAGMYAQPDDFTSYQRFKNIGFHKQHSSSHLITDSAAGATALSCGVKTYNGAIGVDADTQAVETILEEAELKGLATGLVATSTIVHATPGSFIAHVPYRKMYEEIAADFLKTDIDYFVGGGQKYFDQREKDDRNLITELSDKGYIIETFLDYDFSDVVFENQDLITDSTKLQVTLDKNFGFLTSRKSPLPHMQGRTYLMEASVKGVQFLSDKNDNGFFMMIEGSQVDWGGHANNQEFLIDEMVEFDQVVGAILDWAEKDGNTLVVVTGDHECGGVALNADSKRDSLILDFTSDYHTGVMIPVFAYGPGSDAFRGIYQNTEIYNKMRTALGWNNQEKER